MPSWARAEGRRVNGRLHAANQKYLEDATALDWALLPRGKVPMAQIGNIQSMRMSLTGPCSPTGKVNMAQSGKIQNHACEWPPTESIHSRPHVVKQEITLVATTGPGRGFHADFRIAVPAWGLGTVFMLFLL